MEIAFATLSSVASSIGSVVTGGAGALAGGAGGIMEAGLAASSGIPMLGSLSLGTGGSTLTSILSGTASLAGMIGAIGAGNEKAAALEAQAADSVTEAGLEEIKGAERRLSLKRSLLQTIGERDVAYAASGVDLSFGTPSLARDEAQKDAERAISMDVDTQAMRQSRLLERAASYRSQSASARSAGFLKGIGIGVDTLISAKRRG